MTVSRSVTGNRCDRVSRCVTDCCCERVGCCRIVTRCGEFKSSNQPVTYFETFVRVRPNCQLVDKKAVSNCL